MNALEAGYILRPMLGPLMPLSPPKLERQASQSRVAMLHPAQFAINEAWLAFKLNETPIRTEHEGDFNCIALMDAASCFILGNTFAPAGEVEPSKMAVRRLLEEARAHKQELPKTLFIPSGQFDRIVAAEVAFSKA